MKQQRTKDLSLVTTNTCYRNVLQKGQWSSGGDLFYTIRAHHTNPGVAVMQWCRAASTSLNILRELAWILGHGLQILGIMY